MTGTVNHTAPVVCVCATCGSTSVTRDAITRWSQPAQVWEVADVLDNSDCDVCGGESRLTELPVEEWKGETCAIEETSPGSGFSVAARAIPETRHYVGIAIDGDEQCEIVSKDDTGLPLLTPAEAKDAARSWLLNEDLI